MSRAMNRADRLREMERLYRQRGFTDIEMARRLDVHRSTVYKDRQLLAEELPIFKDEHDRYRIDRTSYLTHVRVNLYEALALYLAARRMSRQTRLAQPHVAEALSKLAAALKQPMTEKLVKAADAILAQRADRRRVSVMETLAQAWVEQQKVRIIYRALGRQGQALQHVTHPYLIEPSLWSDGAYLIAYSERMDKIVPFKIERIERATRQTQSFDLPDDFDEQTLLRHAWSIWYTEKEPETVILKFAPGRPARRVRETIWHPHQEIESTGEGGCIWRAPVDEWQEMLPWIRGWGADVEVLAPAGLREEVSGEARRLAEKYGWTTGRGDNASSEPDLKQTFRDFFGGEE